MVTLSTTEAEYIAAAHLHYVDNQSAISVARNPEQHGCIKHPTQEMPANMLTKGFHRVRVQEMLPLLGVENPEQMS
ncbi:hypothetical protein M422DRAFT_38987 [Sphaerobolus stellatus SS14]|uniref:Uncharacterized protein n=1 Tax=Sphaerobolus stellatus (strain SS14) TaxID=990650 RepID=A0A0C9T783_SPHS4|nr:hypothetical protein M422DRAFT_38987 [Sphaerobolus stellatus SS14]